MTRKLYHSLIILALTFLALQGQMLMAQSAPAASGLINAPFGARPGFPGLPVFPTGARQKTGTRTDAAALGLTTQKVYQFRTVDFPAATSSQLYDFADGKAGGYYAFGSSETAFYFKGITNHTLKVPGATASTVFGINAAGHMVGTFNDSKGPHGFLYDGTKFVTLDDPAASSYGTSAMGINDAGVIVGTYNDINDVPHGFLFNGDYTNFDCPNSDWNQRFRNQCQWTDCWLLLVRLDLSWISAEQQRLYPNRFSTSTNHLPVRHQRRR